MSVNQIVACSGMMSSSSMLRTDLDVELFGRCGEVFHERRTEPTCESLSVDLCPVPVAAVLLALPSRLSGVARKWDRGEGDVDPLASDAVLGAQEVEYLGYASDERLTA